MDWEHRCMRLCAGILVFAVVLRLLTAGAWLPVGRALGSAEAASFLLYLHTGRVVRMSLPEQTMPEAPPAPTVPVPVRSFSAGDLQLVQLDDEPGMAPELESLLEQH